MRADIPGRGPVEFERRGLPEGAKHFESLPFCKELPSGIQKWVLDLRYAWGRERSAPSGLVLRACDELENGIYKKTERIRAHLLKVFPDENPDEICAEWLSALMIIRECAERADICTWTMRPQPGEVAYFLGVTMRITRSMIATQNAKRASDEEIAIPAVLNVIEARPEQEQIAFINSVVDGLSDQAAEPGAAPNGGPTERLGNFGVGGVPPSVS